MANELAMKTIAVVAADMVEEAELVQPSEALAGAGARIELLSLQTGAIQSFHDLEMTFGEQYAVDKTVEEADADDYDGLFLPGGVGNPDRLRLDENALRFIRAFFDNGKPVGVICHGPWTLVEADVLRDRTITSWPSLRTDIRNAGGRWVNEQVVVDGGLVSSRMPDDIPAFNAALLEEFGRAPREAATRTSPTSTP
jgi:protease I